MRPFSGKRSGGHAVKAKMEGKPVDGKHQKFNPNSLSIVKWRYEHARGGKVKQETSSHYVSNITTNGYRTICGKRIGADVIKLEFSNKIADEKHYCENCYKAVKKLGY